jgi:hypothetical protein
LVFYYWIQEKILVHFPEKYSRFIIYRMPRKTKQNITVVDIEPTEAAATEAAPAEVVTKAKTPKAKAKAKAEKPIDEAPKIEVRRDVELDVMNDECAPAEDATVVKLETPAKPTIEKVQCPDCQKMVSAKTFKYSHQANCKKGSQNTESVPTVAVPEKVIQTPVTLQPAPLLSLREKRLMAKTERINKLMESAF